MVWEEWSTARAASTIASIDLRLAWQVRADPPFERQGYAATGRGGPLDFAAVRTLVGGGTFRFVQGGVVPVSAGQVLVFERKNLWSYGCDAESWHYWWFRFAGSGPLNVPLNAPMSVGLMPQELASIQEIYDDLRLPIPERRYHASALFAGLLYGWLSRWRTETTATAAQQAVWRVIEAMHERVATGWTVSEMAAAACVGERRLNQLFHSVVGVSPKHYFDGLKLQQAIALLHGRSLSVSQTAAQLGFRDPYYFSRWIGARLGCPPSKVARQVEMPPQLGS
jgi:AraC-like DNA-binding protein